MKNRMKFLFKYYLVILSYFIQVLFLYIYAFNITTFDNIKFLIILLCGGSNILLIDFIETINKKHLIKRSVLAIFIIIVSVMPFFIVKYHCLSNFLYLYLACYITHILIYLRFSFLSIQKYQKCINFQGPNILAFAPDTETTYLDVIFSILSLIIFIVFGYLMYVAL